MQPTTPQKLDPPVFIIILILLSAIFGAVEVYNRLNVPISQNLTASDSTTDWQTYRNEEYGFEISYPKQWEKEVYTTEGSWIFYSKKGEPNLHVGIYTNGCIDPSEDYKPMNSIKISNSLIGESSSITYKYLRKNICVNNFRISLSLPHEAKTMESDKKILDQILSTFRFTSAGNSNVSLLDKAKDYAAGMEAKIQSQPGSARGSFTIQSSAAGDLDGDSRADLAVVTVENSAGTGFFRTLSVFLESDKGPSPSSSVFLGDRVVINALSISNGIISVDMVDHGPTDPSCCPTLKIVKYFKLSQGILEEKK